MGIETLNNAARAAGFAMAPDEGVADEPRPEIKAEGGAWQAGEPVLRTAPATFVVAKSSVSTTDWVKGVFGAFGRRAPA
jgi:hypothetical protein